MTGLSYWANWQNWVIKLSSELSVWIKWLKLVTKLSDWTGLRNWVTDLSKLFYWVTDLSYFTERHIWVTELSDKLSDWTEWLNWVTEMIGEIERQNFHFNWFILFFYNARTDLMTNGSTDKATYWAAFRS